MTRRLRLLVPAFVLAASVAACSSDTAEVESRAEAPSTTVAPAPKTIRLDLPSLPARGLAMNASTGGHRAVVLLDLDGRELARIDGYGLTSPGGREISLISGVYPDYRFFHLDVANSQLVEATTPIAGADIEMLPLPDGGQGSDPSLGHWKYRLPSPDRSRSLAQWSGECEVPTAFVYDGRTVRPIIGTSLEDAPESVALGWLDDTQAIVALWEGGCGNGVDDPGTYIMDVDHPEERRRITELTYGTMWNT